MMGWVHAKDTPAAKLLPKLARLYRALTELKAHQMTIRAGLQARMLAAEQNRDETKEKLWRGRAGISKTPPQSKR